MIMMDPPLGGGWGVRGEQAALGIQGALSRERRLYPRSSLPPPAPPAPPKREGYHDHWDEYYQANDHHGPSPACHCRKEGVEDGSGGGFDDHWLDTIQSNDHYSSLRGPIYNIIIYMYIYTYICIIYIYIYMYTWLPHWGDLLNSRDTR